MITKVSNNPEIYKIEVPLEGSPLKNLSSYVLKSQGASLVVDTGFNMPGSFNALSSGLRELNVDMSDKNTVLFLTHVHSDHVGLVPRIAKGCRILMSAKDQAVFRAYMQNEAWDASDEYYKKHGMPSSELLEIKTANPARAFRPDAGFDMESINDGDTLQIGDVSLTAIATPGHSPGHMCLADLKHSILFAGDHILFDITSNIAVWQGFMEDALGDYLDSLRKIRSLDIQLCLSGHRESAAPANERIDEILAHHDRRLNNILDILSRRPCISAYETASHMTWNMRGKSWREFSPAQKWFAVGETISHLEYLRIRKRISCKMQDGILVWKCL